MPEPDDLSNILGHPDDGEWHYVGTTPEDPGLLDFDGSYVVSPATTWEDTVATWDDIVAIMNRLPDTSQMIIDSFQQMAENLERMDEALRGFQDTDPELFEPRPFSSCDSMSVTFNDGMDERPL